MLEIKGKKATAICYAKVIEDEAVEQIKRMCDYELTEGSSVRIMPDVHSGKGCTIGTTMTIKDKACPNIVGVDIGCGMLTVKLQDKEIDFEGRSFIVDFFFFVAILRKCSGKPKKMVIFISELPVAI